MNFKLLLQGVEIILVVHYVSADSDEIVYRAYNTDNSAENEVVDEGDDGVNQGLIIIYQTNAVMEHVLAPLESAYGGNNIEYTDNYSEGAEQNQTLADTDHEPDDAVDLDVVGQGLELFVGKGVCGVHFTVAVGAYGKLFAHAVAAGLAEFHSTSPKVKF